MSMDLFDVLLHVTSMPVCLQVVQAHRLLERVPAAALQLLSRHLLSAAQQQQGLLLGEFAKQRQRLEQQLELHKTSLHPSMLHPSR